MRKGLRTIIHPVEDLAAAKDWYAKVFETTPYFDEPFYVGFDIGGYELGLVPGEGASQALWAAVDAEAALARAVDAGATVLEEAHEVGGGIMVATAKTPHGHVLGFIENPHFAPPATASASTSREIHSEARVSLSPAEAYAMWASAEGLAQWWATEARVDARPGGHYELYFLEGPRERGSEGCRVLSLLPDRMLSFTWNAPPHLRTREEHTWVVLEFIPDGDGSRVTLTQLGWPEEGMADAQSDWPATFAYFEDAWAKVMGRFETKFAGSS